MSTDRQPLLLNDDTESDNYNPDNICSVNSQTQSTQELRNYVANDHSQLSEQHARTFPQHIAAITATLSAVAAGMVLAWTSPITSQLENGLYNNISISNVEMGWIGSFVSLGAMTMCFPFGIICNILGRKSALLLLIIPFGIGWSLIIWSQTLFMLYCGRFITGMSVGACFVAAPLYNIEIAQKEIRGRLGGYFQLGVTVGIFVAYVIGKYATITQYTFICGAMPFIFFILFMFQPESPVYSIKQNQIETARTSLQRLRGVNYNIDTEIENMKIMLQNSDSDSSFLNSLKKKSTKRAFYILLALMCFQQLSGINAVIFYTSDIFIAAGSSLDPQTATIIVGTFQVVATFISSLIVEKLGRRVLLIGSDFMVAVSCVLLGIFFMLKDRGLVSSDIINFLGVLPLTSLCIFIIMFSIGLGPIPWSISGEMFTPQIRSVAVSIAVTFNWFLAFLITKFYLEFEEQLGADVLFYAFSWISFLGAIFCYCFVPETKGKTIEEVQRDLENLI